MNVDLTLPFEQIAPDSATPPTELAPIAAAGVDWTCAVLTDSVTDDDTRLVAFSNYRVTYEPPSDLAELKAILDEALLPQGYDYEVGSYMASADQLDKVTHELLPGVDPLTLDSAELSWLIGVPNAVYPHKTTTTIILEHGFGSEFGLPNGPDFRDGAHRGYVTRVGYLLRVPWASHQ